MKLVKKKMLIHKEKKVKEMQMIQQFHIFSVCHISCNNFTACTNILKLWIAVAKETVLYYYHSINVKLCKCEILKHYTTTHIFKTGPHTHPDSF